MVGKVGDEGEGDAGAVERREGERGGLELHVLVQPFPGEGGEAEGAGGGVVVGDAEGAAAIVARIPHAPRIRPGPWATGRLPALPRRLQPLDSGARGRLVNDYWSPKKDYPLYSISSLVQSTAFSPLIPLFRSLPFIPIDLDFCRGIKVRELSLLSFPLYLQCQRAKPGYLALHMELGRYSIATSAPVAAGFHNPPGVTQTAERHTQCTTLTTLQMAATAGKVSAKGRGRGPCTGGLCRTSSAGRRWRGRRGPR